MLSMAHPALGFKPTNPSMRFVSSHSGAQTRRHRWPCQLQTSRQAAQRLRHHFVALQAFAFACPRVPDRVGSFLRSPILISSKRDKAAAVPLNLAEQTLGSLDCWALISNFKRIKHQSAQGRGEQGSVSHFAQYNLMSMSTPHNDCCELAQVPTDGFAV